ncbi:hypothetical protein DERP_003339 [Dermatophagoides pteronyssinus]|uniref:Uncharacterized protein n=1 Tax=Dermatophagoides pteronyssinus TaxID=6956 RepID=A0ABQ8JJ76_DERPT|nr:hypothetical protein DERP_003339 [Dermatophagoides pteronyssinus]
MMILSCVVSSDSLLLVELEVVAAVEEEEEEEVTGLKRPSKIFSIVTSTDRVLRRSSNIDNLVLPGRRPAKLAIFAKSSKPVPPAIFGIATPRRSLPLLLALIDSRTREK